MDPAIELDEPADGEHSTDPMSEHGDAADKPHQPPSGEENSPDEDAHIIPETHLVQENLRRRLIATARNLKKQKQRLKATQNTLNSKWNKVIDNEEKYGGSYHTKSYPKRKLLPEFDDEALEPTHPKIKRPTSRINHLVAAIERLTRPHISQQTIYMRTCAKNLV